MDNSLQNSTRLLLAGLSAGDCIGVTSEFKSQDSVRKMLETQDSDWPLAQVGGGPFGFGAGVGSDDTDMAMPIASAIVQDLTEPEFITCVARGFVDWYRSGPRDIGGTTRTMLRGIAERIDDGMIPRLFVPAANGAKQDPRSWSNGALMRNGVAASIGVEGDWRAALDATLNHTALTHQCLLPVMVNLVHTIGILQASMPEFSRALDPHTAELADTYMRGSTTYAAKAIKAQFDSREAFEYEMGGCVRVIKQALEDVREGRFNPFENAWDTFKHQGYCLLTLKVAHWVLEASTDNPDVVKHVPDWFPDKVRALTGAERLAWVGMIGHDSDTYGAAAGPLVAAQHGTVPAFLTQGLKALEQFDQNQAAVKA